MNEYLVKVRSPEVRDRLAESFEKVGKGEAMRDFVIVKTAKPIEALEKFDGVLEVEIQGKAEIAESFGAEANLLDFSEGMGWAKPWISNTSGTYENPKYGGGVTVYVIDTGIMLEHEEFEGRASTLYTFDGQNYSNIGDQAPFHGTAVASCVAGKLCGTARYARILNCRIDFTTTDILKALDTILRHHLDKPDDQQSVVNFSGASISKIIGDAFERLTQYGIVVVASAGNYSEAKPRYPARSDWVMSVGSINRNGLPSIFTNKMADVYAPGEDVKVASIFGPTSYELTSGTSFSAPYTSGCVAALLSGSDKCNSSDEVSDLMHKALTVVWDQNRIYDFDADGLPIVTLNSKGLGRVFYNSPSKLFTDEQIAPVIASIAGNPQEVADKCKEYNISLKRLTRICDSALPEHEIGFAEVNKYFEDANVTPWWFT